MKDSMDFTKKNACEDAEILYIGHLSFQEQEIKKTLTLTKKKNNSPHTSNVS
jgi:hypothetical protein